MATVIAVCAGSAAGAPQIGLRTMMFTDYSPLSGNAELARRALSPLVAADLQRELKLTGKVLEEQAIKLAGEKFAVYVPAEPPPQGYGLLVFVPPWTEAAMPDGWGPVFEQRGMIYVSVAGSGNDASVLGRREPLALIALRNIQERYPIDPQRVYVGGFSGGSRVAQRLALAYPDVFHGALLNAGSDPIGDALRPLPPKDLFWRFQAASRLVYITGAKDPLHLQMDAESLHSMRGWCVFNTVAEEIPFVPHRPASPAVLARALDALAQPTPPDAERLAACRGRIEGELKAKLDEARALIARGRRDEAKKLLIGIDRRFGGLAAPDVVELTQAAS